MAETCKLHLLPWNDSILCYLLCLFNFIFIRLSIQHHSYSRDANAKRHTLSCQFVCARACACLCASLRNDIRVGVCAPIFMAKVANNMDLHIKRNCVNCNSFYGWWLDCSPVIYLFHHKYIVYPHIQIKIHSFPFHSVSYHSFPIAFFLFHSFLSKTFSSLTRSLSFHWQIPYNRR